MKVVCCGDSITFGEGVNEWARWTSIVQRALHDHQIVNCGVCGDTSRLGLERFPEDVQRHQPDAVVIQFGLNDCNKWDTDEGLSRVSPRAFEANLCEMVQRSKHFGAEHVAIVGLTPTTRESCLPQWWRYAGKLRTACEHSGATHVNPGTGVGHESFLLEDGVHLNELGNQRVAESILAWLAPIVNAQMAVAA